MTTLFNIFLAGGFMMFPLLILSVVTLAYAMQRAWIWFNLAVQERQVVQDVLTVAQYDWEQAEEMATSANDLAIGRFLSTPLKLNNPTPEDFNSTVEASADRELIDIGGNNKLLESVIVIAPLLGLLGTAGALIFTFITLRNGNGDTNSVEIANSILRALISSAAGIAIAIMSFVFMQIFASLRKRRVDYFSTVGNQLKLIYLHIWHQPIQDAKIN